MGFCTNCGTKLDDSQRFCTGCGAQQAAAPQPVAAVPPAPALAAPQVAAAAPAPAPVPQPQGVQPIQPVPAKGGGGLLKVILIIVGILVFLGILAGGVIAYIGYRASKAVKVDANGNVTSVETPFGKVTTNEDTKKIAEQLGVDVYPGAKPLEGAGSVSFGDNLSFGNAEFETSDSLEKVEEFYKKQLPKSAISSTEENQRTMVATTAKAMITVVLERQDDKTIIRLGKAEATNTGTSNSE